MVKEASCKKKEDFFFPSDKDIRKDIKAWQGHWETHQGTMVMPWDYGNAMKHVRGHWNQSSSFGNEGIGGQW